MIIVCIKCGEREIIKQAVIDRLKKENLKIEEQKFVCNKCEEALETLH